MTEFFIGFALSNLVASVVLAGIAYAVHRQGRLPVLAHLLWVLVLLKLVTPPVLSLPISHIPGVDGIARVAAGDFEGPLASASGGSPIIDQLVAAGLLVWLVGSLAILAVSLLRIYRFERLLRRTSRPAPGWIGFMAGDLAHRMGLSSGPAVRVTSARISPMTWWTGRRIWVVLPQGLAQDIESDQLAWVLGHELAHVKRRDHLVRWLEWFACVSFWWNPVAWWARRNLRLDEESACDALVMERLHARPRSYARALLAVVEHLARPALEPPAVATGIDGGVSLERRFRLIVDRRHVRRAPRWLAIGLVGTVVASMPVGVGYATDVEPAPMRTAARPADSMSDGERAFLAGSRRGAGAPSESGQAVNLATLSAKVGAKPDKKAVSKSKKARHVRRAKGGKAAARAKRIRARKRAERQAGAPSPSLVPSGPADRSTRL